MAVVYCSQQCSTRSLLLHYTVTHINLFFFLSVPSQCFMESGRYGQCIKVQQCPSIYKSFLDGKEIKDVCGYSGAFPIVCCPSISGNGSIYDKIQNLPGQSVGDSKFIIFPTPTCFFFIQFQNYVKNVQIRNRKFILPL